MNLILRPHENLNDPTWSVIISIALLLVGVLYIVVYILGIDDMNDEQKVMVSHIADLTRKMETMNFNMQQLEFGKQAFVNALKKTLEEVTEEK